MRRIECTEITFEGFTVWLVSFMAFPKKTWIKVRLIHCTWMMDHNKHTGGLYKRFYSISLGSKARNHLKIEHIQISQFSVYADT